MLRFKPEADIEDVDDILRRDLSASALVGRTLFVACEETATVECLTTEDWQVFAGHEPLRLATYFDLPGGAHAEMDIEGLAAADSYLWIVGSHSLTCDKPKREKKPSNEAIKRLKMLDRGSNRFFLGRVPLVSDPEAPGCFGLGASGAVHQTPGRKSAKPDLTETTEETMRSAAALEMTGKGNALTKALKDDKHTDCRSFEPSARPGHAQELSSYCRAMGQGRSAFGAGRCWFSAGCREGERR